MLVSLKTKKFYKFFECVDRIIKLNHKEIIDEEVFKSIVKVFNFHV